MGRARGTRVLLVEDNEINREATEDAEINVDLAENGEIAVRMVQEKDYDLVLMDMQMPVMDGLEATREIRKHEAETGLPRTPVVALTANAFADQVCFIRSMTRS